MTVGDRREGTPSTLYLSPRATPAIPNIASPPVFDITPPCSATIPEQDAINAQRPSRSKFKNFFTRRRLSPSPEQPNSAVSLDGQYPIQQTSIPHQSYTQHLQVHPKPALSARAYSETSVPQTGSSRATVRQSFRESPSTPNVTDTSSFLYAFSRATLRSTARTPIRRPQPILDDVSQGSSSPCLPEHPFSDSRCASSYGQTSLTDAENLQPGMSSMVEKLFVMGDGARILQYETTGLPDRSPERVFQLTSDALALPSGTFAEKGIALEITTSVEATEQVRPKTNRSTWTRNPFRGTSTKRSSDSLVIVFDDVDVMSAWISAIRKQVEGLRGSHARPVSAWSSAEKSSPALRNASTERFSLRQSFLQLSRSSSSLRQDYTETTNTKEQSLLPVPPPPPSQRSSTSRSRATSSTGTTTSLDRLRESDANSTTTGATNSLDGSVVLDSPVKETFASLTSPTLAFDSKINSPSEAFPQRVSSVPQLTLQERRERIVSQLRLSSSTNSSPLTNSTSSQDTEKQDTRSRTSEEEAEEVTFQIGKARPVSILAPLPSPDEIKKPSKLQRTYSTECVEALDQPATMRPASSYEGHRSRPSTDANGKSMYSLFPKKRVEPPKSEPLVVPEMNNIPGLSQTHATDHLILPPTPTVAITPAHGPASSRTSLKKPSPLKLLAPINIEQAQRSPAVTADMLASNFGTFGCRVDPSPISPRKINVPTFDDLKFDFSFLKHDFGGLERRQSDTPPLSPSDAAIKRPKSTPSLRVARPTAAPLGPPPSRPLPAVPPEEVLQSHPTSPAMSTSREQRKSDRADSTSPPSRSRRKSPPQSLKNTPPSPPVDVDPLSGGSKATNSPLAPVGIPSIISPPPSATKSHDRQRSRTKSVSSIKSHKRAKSSGKYALGITMKNFPATPVLCDKDVSFYC